MLQSEVRQFLEGSGIMDLHFSTKTRHDGYVFYNRIRIVIITTGKALRPRQYTVTSFFMGIGKALRPARHRVPCFSFLVCIITGVCKSVFERRRRIRYRIAVYVIIHAMTLMVASDVACGTVGAVFTSCVIGRDSTTPCAVLHDAARWATCNCWARLAFC